MNPGRGQDDQEDVCGQDERAGCVPSGTVEQQNRVCALGHYHGDLVEMGLYGVRVGEGHGERRAMDGAVRAGLDDPGEPDQLVLRQPGRMSLGSNIAEPGGAAFVKPMDPITQRLSIHAAERR